MIIQNICASGGAIGSDLEWGQKASYNNMTVIHFSFKGHKITANKDDIYILNEDELNEANEPCLSLKMFPRTNLPSVADTYFTMSPLFLSTKCSVLF